MNINRPKARPRRLLFVRVKGVLDDLQAAVLEQNDGKSLVACDRSLPPGRGEAARQIQRMAFRPPTS